MKRTASIFSAEERNVKTRSSTNTEPQRNFRVIGVYNYKGGVGKTTLTLNLAVSICQEHNKKVLIVDADTQRSASLFFYPGEQAYHRTEAEEAETPDQHNNDEESIKSVEISDTEEDGVVPIRNSGVVARYPEELLRRLEVMPNLNLRRGDRVLDPRAQTIPEPNLFSVLVPVLNGSEEFGNGGIAKIAVDCPRLLQERLGDRLILLRGNSRIKEYQHQMSQATTATFPALRNSLGAFRALVHELAKELQVDVVLVDFGPSTDTLNETFVMSCDYILPPCFPDTFSNSSMQSFLRSLLPDWKANLDRNVRRQLAYAQRNHDPSNRIKYPLCRYPPIILSAIVTTYRIYNSAVTMAHTEWIRQIHETFATEVPRLKELGIQCRLLRGVGNRACGALALYRDFLSLHGVCHKLLLPITALNEQDVKRACRMGLKLNTSDRLGSVHQVVTDTREKVGILGHVLLRLPIPSY